MVRIAKAPPAQSNPFRVILSFIPVNVEPPRDPLRGRVGFRSPPLPEPRPPASVSYYRVVVLSIPVVIDSPAELTRRAGAGDRSAEQVLCQRLVPAVRAFARRRLIGAEAVDEFTQDALVLFVEALRQSSIREPERVGGFMLGICRNLALDRARQRERRQALWERYGEVFEPFTPAASETHAYEVAQLEDCMSQLSRRAREVVRLSYIEAKSHAEVAHELAISEGNARVLRHRTLEALRDCMTKHVSWEGA